MDNNEFLPIGTVVSIKNSDKDLMILGYKMTDEASVDKVEYDYLGCIASIGIKSLSSYLFFNRDQIEKIVSYGYKDELWEALKELLNE